jgi:hypothetical protein
MNQEDSLAIWVVCQLGGGLGLRRRFPRHLPLNLIRWEPAGLILYSSCWRMTSLTSVGQREILHQSARGLLCADSPSPQGGHQG